MSEREGVGTENVTPERLARVEAALDERLGSVVAVMESVRRRHNASAIIRSAESFGIHEVHLITEGFRPSVGAARGAERWVVKEVYPDIDSSVAALKARGFRVYIADWQPDAFTPETVPVNQPLAIVFGTELKGVSPRARALADGVIAVPMRGLTMSLNVSVSAAIILRSVAERRRALVGSDLSVAARAAFVEAWLAAEVSAERGFLARTAE